MPTELLSPDDFLTRLTESFSTPQTAGSIWLTHKRLSIEDGGDAEDEEAEHEVLIRCTRGDGSKFSSKIPASSLHTFHTTYGTLLKSTFAPHMRKRDKKKEKARADAVAAKRRELYVDVDIGSGGKRGKGRRQRERKIRAQHKKEEEREKVEARETKANGSR
ncbi:hypothetical protein BCR39DRAFT_513482 [Naematelia encephala]|uniref:Signal recognition particle subunit SRP14 n=1 Tax=Naematelia encephala TaxID=71784 RepID=A0A1Y2BIH1_9TREE|nr:hypothetical protein BCR39DRAFT_513482 [Naematelia encephala]